MSSSEESQSKELVSTDSSSSADSQSHEAVNITDSVTCDTTVMNPSKSVKKDLTTSVNTIGKKTKRGRKKKGKERSDVWAHFSKELHPIFDIVDGVEKKVGHTMRARCKYCSTHLACDTISNGTSSLKKHIEVVCKKYPGRVNIETGQQMLTSGSQGSLISKNWSQEACVEAATHMIVVDELPFSFIERPGFNYFCSVAMPVFKVPKRKVICKTFLRMYDAKREDLKKELKSHCISLTTDTWTSCQNINYMVVTAHFIDEGWQMHKRVLAFCVIENHQGITIGKILEECLLDWEIEKVLTISVDNASANKIAIDYLKDKMRRWEKKPIYEGKFMHVRCLAHIVNLIVKSGLNMMEKSVASIRKAVRYVRSSAARLAEFRRCMEKEKIDCNKICILDVPTRWNSTFLMLDTALELRRAFDRLVDDNQRKFTDYFDEEEESEEDEDVNTQNRRRILPPSNADWDNAAYFVKFLKVFYDVTLNVSAQLIPTAHKAFHDIVTIEAELEDLLKMAINPVSTLTDSEKILYDMAVKMKAKYSKYFGSLDDMNQLFLVALVLDPRYKLRNIGRVCHTMLNLSLEVIKKKTMEVKEFVIHLCDLYGQNNGAAPHTSDTSSEKDKITSRPISGRRAAMMEDWYQQLEENGTAVVGNEVDRYLLDPIEKPENNDEWKILDWWKVNGSKYPNLQLVAKDVLAIQVSTVASESSFSTGKRVVDPYRSSLNPKTVEKLICLQNWLKSDAIMGLQYAPTTDEMEIYEKVEEEYEKEEKERAEKENKERAEKEKPIGRAGSSSKTSKKSSTSTIISKPKKKKQKSK